MRRTRWKVTTFWCSTPARVPAAGIVRESTPSGRSTTASRPVSSAPSRTTASNRSSPCSTPPPGSVQVDAPSDGT